MGLYIVKMILEQHGADYQIRNTEQGVCFNIEFLYNHGTEFDVSEAAKNPLFGAIYGGYYNVVQFLVEHGIDITKSYPIGELDHVDGC